MHRVGCRNSYDGGKIAGLYDLEETLGRGHFAVVKLARHVFTGEKVAVKVIDKTKLDEVSRAHLFQEVRCMKLVQHPNVVRLYEVIDTHSKLYLILELADGGDLYDYIMKHESGLSETVAQEYFAQIVRAISYCHRLHVVHRDLKPENVVFFERLGVVKLTDFGFSNKFHPGQKLETSCGSLAYSAPEILLGDSYDAPAVDIWSLGVILYMLVCGQAPFQEANDSETLTMIMDCKYKIPNYVSEDCKRLIARMLVRQPEKRATLDEIAADPWLKNSQYDGALPLISRLNITEEDHSTIVQRMVNGGIATKEQILEAIDKDAYNHITASYYLLAERKLRSLEPKQKLIGKQIPKVNVDPCSENDANNANYQNSHTLLGNPRPTLDIVQRARKCSIVTEEEDEDDDPSDGSHHSSLNRRGSRSEGKLNLAVQELRKEQLAINAIITETNPFLNPHSSAVSVACSSSNSCSSSPRANKMLPPPLVSARSSPQLGLDEIAEDTNGGGDSIVNTTIGNISNVRSSGAGSLTPRKFLSYEQRRSRFTKSRTTSCSSSEASDEDNENRKKRAAASAKTSQHSSKDPDGPTDGGNDGGGPSASGSSSTGGGGGGNNNSSSHSQDHQSSNDTSNERNEPGGNNFDGRFEMSSSNTNTNTNNNNNSTGRRNCLQGRHRRRVEIRLRESQSLNRITEVQELVEPSQLLSSKLTTITITKTINNTQLKEQQQQIQRQLLLSRVINDDDDDDVVVDIDGKNQSGNKSVLSDDCGGRSLYSNNNNNNTNEKFNNNHKRERSKRNALIGKYLNIQKKICIPLLLKRGRLYKAQSCSEVRSNNINIGGTNGGPTSESKQNLRSTVAVTNGICHLHLNKKKKSCKFC